MPDSIDAVFAGPDEAFSGAGLAVFEARDPAGVCEGASEGVSGGVSDPVRDGLERDLMQCATALTNDEIVARAVTHLALARLDSEAEDLRLSGQAADPPGQAGLYRMVRQAYHSIERTRVRRAPRPAAGVV